MAGTFRESPPPADAHKSGVREPPSTSWRPRTYGPRTYGPRTSPPSRPPRFPHRRGSGRPPHAGLCTAIAAAALVMLSAATVVHAASGDGGTWQGAWTAIMPDAFQFDRHGAAPPPAHALPESAYAASGGTSEHTSGAGRGTWGSSLRDGSYEPARDGGWGGGTSEPSRGHALIPNAYADDDDGSTAGRHTGATPMPFHDRWALGEGLAQGSAYAYLICGAPADPPACFEATLVVVRRDDGAPVEGSAYSHAAPPIPWHIRVTIQDLIGYYARDGSGFRMSDYTAAGTYDQDMRTLRSAALFDGEPPDPWSFDLRFTGVRYEPRPVHPDPAAMRYAGALEDTIFLLGSKIAIEMGPYNDRHPILEDGEQWPNSVDAAVHVRESVSGYDHDYLYGTVDIRGGEPGSGRAMHRVSYTGDAVPMADLIVADGIPFPLSGSVRDTVLPTHFASDPHVDSRWWFRLVALSPGPGMAARSDSPGVDATAAPVQRSGPPPAAAPVPTSGSAPDGTAPGSADAMPPATSTGGAAPTSAELPPINIPRISGLLNNPAGLYDYLAELAGKMAAAGGGGGAATGTGTPQHPADMPPLTVSTDRTSYTRGQLVSISGMADAGAGGASRTSPFVLISLTGQGGSSVDSMLAPIDPSATGTVPYTASVDTSGWGAAQAPAGNMTVIAVRGSDTAATTFVLRDGNASAAPNMRPPPSQTDASAPHTTPAEPSAPEPRPPLTIAPSDVAYRHGETVVLSGTATARHVRDSLVLLTMAGPGGTTLAGLTTHVTPDGLYSRGIPTGGWPAEYGTVTVAAVRGTDTASATFELLPPASAEGRTHEIPASVFSGLPGTGIVGANGTLGIVPSSPASAPDPDIGSAGIRSHIRYMIDANQTVSDLILYDHSIVVYLGAPNPNPPEATPTLWLRIPRDVMDPPDMDGDGRVFDVRIDGAVSTSHAETSDDTHRTLSIPVLHSTGVVDVSGPIASAPPDGSSGGGGGGAAIRPSVEPPAAQAPAPTAQQQQCSGSARCLRATITSVPAADHIMLSGGMSVRLALVSVPAPLEPGGEQARRLVASICPAGEQASIDEDDLGASAAASTFRNRIVAEAFCNDGTVSIQDVLVASGLGSVDRRECSTSEFASRPWAAGECGAEAGRR